MAGDAAVGVGDATEISGMKAEASVGKIRHGGSQSPVEMVADRPGKASSIARQLLVVVHAEIAFLDTVIVALKDHGSQFVRRRRGDGAAALLGSIPRAELPCRCDDEPDRRGQGQSLN